VYENEKKKIFVEIIPGIMGRSIKENDRGNEFNYNIA
jgi:hypothetical protein